ncbi:MAG: Helix-turn-helix domain [Dehalococcoidia bacterium]|nr:Helix-turn-helix domain [Dehalococcoidia bacterium]
MATSIKVLLSERETMEALGIGRTLLRRMWAEGRIKPVKVGRRLLFHVDEVRRFAEEMQRGAEA